ncbi:MAG TPA: transglycosylase domain-containing protein [Gemmatimonadaceae bacterium]|jgi:penicillin-binding protein 1A|nr:transglycosylase domain-containing protein [Gemmatimonadaceae bacterium]
MLIPAARAVAGRAFLVASLATALATIVGAQDTTPGKTSEAWQIVPLAQSTLVYARDGTLIGEIGREMRTNVPMRTLPKYVAQAFIAIEDQRFYEHGGGDPRAMVGVLKGKLLGENRGGGSTITQQLVGYMHPDIIDRREVSGVSGVSRKFHEVEAAIEMEKHYTKDQILEAYLNQIDLGRGWYGVEAGARHYFGHPASKLTLAEAATLAGLPKSQPYYDPISHPDRARERRNLILQKMAEQGYITPDAAEKAKLEPMVASPNSGMSAASGYFVDAVKQQAERAGIRVNNGGYRIYTTLDPALQRDAVSALVEGTNKIEAEKGYKHLTQAEAKGRETDYLQGMAIAIDPFTGDVRALVGGRNYARAPFDRALNSKRQPGSSIKPIVYAKAIEDGVPANTILPDTALMIPLVSDPDHPYEPQENDGKFWGMTSWKDGKPTTNIMSMREGLIHSRNMTAIQIGQRVGMDSVAALSLRMGISSPMDPVPSSAIGASVVRPIELVAAYTAFANNGAVVQPRFITTIDDSGGQHVYRTPASTPQQVLDPRVAFIVRDMMRDVAERGSGVPARKEVPDGVPMAGKTGTTNDNVDVWFVGMTPEIVAAVWLGFDQPKTIAHGAVGSTLAAPIWGQMIGRYYATRTSNGWGPPPDGLVYAELDRETARPATVRTSPDKRYVEYFLPGTEPPELRNNPWKIPQWGPLFQPLRVPPPGGIAKQ